MRLLVMIVVVAITSRLLAVSVKLPENMESQFADKVSIFDTELPADRFMDLRKFRLEIRVLASCTNSIAVRMGRDSLFGVADNCLSMAETMCEFEIETNSFVLRRDRFRQSYTHTPADPGISKERVFSVECRVSPDNPAEIRSMVLKESDTPFTFDGLDLSSSCPVDLNPAYWTDMRVLIRNGGVQDVECMWLKDGALLIIR